MVAIAKDCEIWQGMNNFVGLFDYSIFALHSIELQLLADVLDFHF